jgi:hypothetical protein
MRASAAQAIEQVPVLYEQARRALEQARDLLWNNREHYLWCESARDRVSCLWAETDERVKDVYYWWLESVKTSEAIRLEAAAAALACDPEATSNQILDAITEAVPNVNWTGTLMAKLELASRIFEGERLFMCLDCRKKTGEHRVNAWSKALSVRAKRVG